MKVYTIIGGPYGCGKSSLLGILRSEVDNIGRVINEYDNTEISNNNINTNEYFINLLRNVSKAVFALLKK